MNNSAFYVYPKTTTFFDNLNHIFVGYWDKNKNSISKVNILLGRVSLELSKMLMFFLLECLVRLGDLTKVDQF